MGVGGRGAVVVGVDGDMAEAEEVLVSRTHMLEVMTKQRPSMAAVRIRGSQVSRWSAVGAR